MTFDTDNTLFDALMDVVHEQMLEDELEKQLLDDIAYVLFKHGIVDLERDDQMFQVPELLKEI